MLLLYKEAIELPSFNGGKIPSVDFILEWFNGSDCLSVHYLSLMEGLSF